MEAFTQITAQAMPLPIKDVDTDMIIPAQYLTSISREGYGQNVFRRLRDEDPEFPFNLEKFEDAKILVAESNFGCGSSREHAVWALLGWGIRVVIAPSFADIFFNNSAKNGLVLVQLDKKIIDDMLEKAAFGDYEFTVDLENQTVTLPDGIEHTFEFDPFRKQCILQGYDELDYIFSHKKEVEEYKKNRNKNLFYSTLTPNNS